jgi:hypothetical protein
VHKTSVQVKSYTNTFENIEVQIVSATMLWFDRFLQWLSFWMTNHVLTESLAPLSTTLSFFDHHAQPAVYYSDTMSVGK